MKNKIIFSILFVVLFLLTVFTIQSSAYSYKDGENTIDFGNIDTQNFSYLLIFKDSSSYTLWSFPSDDLFYKEISDYVNFRYNCECITYNYKISTGEVTRSNRPSGCTKINKDNLIYSNFDLKDDVGNVVFQKPVPPEPEKPAVTVKLEKVEELPNLVNNLLTILLPVGLVIFSLFLVIYLIASKRWRPI